jgi:hypothetical protein
LGSLVEGTMRSVFYLAVLCLLSTSVSSAQNTENWSFAVSGDSRNCGDIVMPAIAAGVHKDGARFYWHLGDFRANYDFDQDLLAGPEYRTRHISPAEYQRVEWPDFIAQQLEPFGETPVRLVIGNHELAPPKTRLDYLQQFADWLDAPPIREQRLNDDPHDHTLRTYYHWIERGVDFIAVDNASEDQFDDAQLRWLERTLTRDENDPAVRSIVVGMHDALPDSLTAGHSMNESAQMERSGRKAYQDLLDFRSKAKKPVYVLASHSHFFVENVYNDACHTKSESVLPGWIVGTAGAVRYRLPKDMAGAKQAKTDVYGYLLGTVESNGNIQFTFKEVHLEDVPPQVNERYGRQVQACFVENKSPYVPEGPTCSLGKIPQ